jgi:hypothetical protein
MPPVTVFAAQLDLGTIAISGKDRAQWLNGLVSCNVAAVAPGVFHYGLALSKVGRILSDLVIGSDGDRLLVGAPRGRVERLREHFEKHLMMEDAAHSDAGDELAWIFAHGPRAVELSNPLRGTGIADGALVVPSGDLEKVLADLRGMPYVLVAEKEDWEHLLIDRMVPRFGVDFGDTNYPHEARLERSAVAWNKGCYLGQEVVCRLEMRGHASKLLVGIRLDAAEAPAPGTEICSADGIVVGHVSSATRSTALAIVPREHARAGTKLLVGDLPGVVRDI